MKLRVSILSIEFKYVPAEYTDVAHPFARIRHERRERAEQRRLAGVASELTRVAAANDAALSCSCSRSF